jgi:plastocyanin
MRRRLLGIAGLVGLLAAGAGLTGPARAGLAGPEPNAIGTNVHAPVPCTAEAGNTYEQGLYANWANGVRYPGDCQRLQFAYGPLTVKPGQNDVLLSPVSIDKPAYAGYMVRMKPNLVAVDPKTGSTYVPEIQQLHLHHATWLSAVKDGINRQSPDWTKTRPWFASGEEKTIADLPDGYGWPISPSDDWELLYMIHNLTTSSFQVYITYDIDYVATTAAQRLGLKAAYPIWLDVGPSNAANYGYPVFNVQRRYGDANNTCTWPAQYCSDVDPWGGQSSNNGVPDTSRLGTDFVFPSAGARLGDIANFHGGSIIAIGGHLHPGGVSDNIDLVRNDTSGTPVAKRIFTSQAEYWDHDPTKRTVADGPKTSWDLSMTWTGLPRWAVHVNPGDHVRINATYDTSNQSTYEDMGIAIAYVAPDDSVGLDPFNLSSAPDTTDTDPALCLQAGVLCTTGVVTHGHLDEASHYGGPDGVATQLSAMPAQVANQVHIAGFVYTPGDLSTAALTGVPVVKLGQSLTFVNEDAAADVYHTATSCNSPCNGADTGIEYPLANAVGVDYDSSELGFGVPNISGASQRDTWDLNVTSANGFQAGHTYTYFCRIHPFMRGAFQVSGQ